MEVLESLPSQAPNLWDIAYPISVEIVMIYSSSPFLLFNSMPPLYKQIVILFSPENAFMIDNNLLIQEIIIISLTMLCIKYSSNPIAPNNIRSAPLIETTWPSFPSNYTLNDTCGLVLTRHSQTIMGVIYKYIMTCSLSSLIFK